MRKRVRLFAGFVAVMLAMTAVASAQTVQGPFDDVPDEHLFVDDVQWMKDNGISFGCNPPENTLYCPDDNTTRGQEAAFFHRFANAGVVDAGTIDGKDSDEFAASKGNDGPPAADSDKLDGLDSSDFVQTGDPVGDADSVDGKHADDFAAAEGTDGPPANDSANLGGVPASEYVSSIFYIEEVVEEPGLLTEGIATCPEGSKVISGGYRAEGLLAPLSPVSVTENGPVDPGEGNVPTQWKVSVNITIVPEVGALVVQALCAE